jgi:flagellar hook-basal body complex protein FliE
MLNESMSEVNQLQKDANTAIEKLATGKNKDISETMLMVEKADIAFKAMNQIRTKVIEAYKEIMRMQV